MDEPNPQPVVPPEPDPLRDLAGRLDAEPGRAELHALVDPVALSRLAALVVAEARAQPSPAWSARLDALRAHVFLQNQRAAYGLCLGGIADVAAALGDPDRQIAALGKLVGLRDLQREPERAHDATLALAAAQEAAGRADAAEATLLDAVERARKLAPGGHLREASVRTADSLLRLGRLLAVQGRTEEARAWLEGARDIAPDEDLRAAAAEALAAI